MILLPIIPTSDGSLIVLRHTDYINAIGIHPRGHAMWYSWIKNEHIPIPQTYSFPKGGEAEVHQDGGVPIQLPRGDNGDDRNIEVIIFMHADIAVLGDCNRGEIRSNFTVLSKLQILRPKELMEKSDSMDGFGV
ncbi:expressed unknown protein [Seminavis robusta]|uniref:Uncharacterized protein n=1 Tax=Seminavis robusta TaxID=568900 RepID=A0A9N8F0D1_9STRA|nr:expressed unknown protein [Seminavis robusta]|eukprot:Sro2199_g318780.1 n/a (134) ;mRNA; f:12911-13312